MSFRPRSVRDGQTSLVDVTATDDQSGVSTVSGTLSSPSGKAVVGFTAKPQAAGDVFTAAFEVPRKAEGGRWFVQRIHIADKAGNVLERDFTVEETPDEGVLDVRSAGNDSSAPSLRAAWIEKKSIAGGEPNRLFVQADDDGAGIQTVNGVFKSPRKSARAGFGARFDEERGVWVAEVSVPAKADCGEWTLEAIQMIDRAGNRSSFDTTNPIVKAVSFAVSAGDGCDSLPPYAQTLTMIPGVVSSSTGGLVEVTALLGDDQSGVASASGRVDGPPRQGGGRSPMLYFTLKPRGSDSREWVGTIRVPKLAARGTWSVSSLQVVDLAGNFKVYNQNESPIAGVTFHVD